MRAHDTAEEAHAIQVRRYQEMSPARKSEIVGELSDTVRSLARDGIRRRHPNYNDDEVRQALTVLLYGPDIAHRIWPNTELPAP
jgi:hypothetical protein